MRQIVGDWLANNNHLMDFMVVAAAAKSPAFFRVAQPILCKLDRGANKEPEWLDEFTDPSVLPIYRAVYDYNLLMLGPVAKANEEVGFTPVVPATLGTFLSMYAANGQHITVDEIPMCLEKFVYALTNFSDDQAIAFTRTALNPWMYAQKSRCIMRSSLNRRDHDVVIDQLHDLKTRIQNRDNKFDLHGFGSGIDNAELDVERIPTRFMPLDVALGGGLGRKEGTLVIAAPGVGKTVFACQMASNMAISGAKTLLISTEQKHRELEPRIVSAQCNIPFNLIKDKFRPEILQPDQMERYRKLRTALNDKTFVILNWNDTREKNIFSVIDSMIEQVREMMGGLDALYLDWLGAALGEHASNDPGEYRLILKRGANAFVDAVDRHNLAGAVFAQGHPSLAINKLRVDASTLAECKTLGERMTNVMGLTGFLSKEEDDGSEPIFQEKQYYYISKARKSAGNKVPVRRDFGFQRFGYV